MKIYIPTRGRADDQVTLSFFPESLRKEVVLVIDSDEEHLYKDKYDCQFMLYQRTSRV